MASEEKRIEEELSHPIMLSERVRLSIDEAKSFKLECVEVGKQVDRLSQMVRTVVRFATTTPALYERPIRRIIAEVSANVARALALVRKCKRRSVVSCMVTITSAADFRKIFNRLDDSIGDMKWLITVFEAGGGIWPSLPPIAGNDPNLSCFWSLITSIQMGQLPDRIEGANELASFAKDNDRNKKMIVEEGGVPPLLKLLKESSSPEAQIAAAKALCNLANDQERVRVIVNEQGVPIIVQALGDSPLQVQIETASLVARMVENDPFAQEDFARENVVRPLVTLLSFETFMDAPKSQFSKQSIHSIVQINKEMEKNSSIKSSNYRPYASSSSNSNRSSQNRKERENEKPEVKLLLKTKCAEALWVLARNNVSNSRRITETKGLLCLAKLVEKERDELQFNCLMTIMEITSAAESNTDLRCAAFKTNSLAAKAVVDQMLRVVEEIENPDLKIAALRSIGSLARAFPLSETRVIGPLVAQLGNSNQDVATEAAVSLAKFSNPENYLYKEHVNRIIEFNGIPSVMKMLRGNEQAQLHGLILLCYLALYGGKTEALEQARVLTILEGADRTVVAQHPEWRGLVSKAIYHLNLYHTGVHSQRHSIVL